MKPTPQTDAFRIPNPCSYDSVLSRYIQRLERRAATWAKSAREWRYIARIQGRQLQALTNENAENAQRIISLICERDRLQYRANERRALRTEIELALGMESLPGDTEDSSLNRGLAVIQAMKARAERAESKHAEVCGLHCAASDEVDTLIADLARVTAEREEIENDLRDADIGADKRVRRMLEAEEKVRMQFTSSPPCTPATPSRRQ